MLTDWFHPSWNVVTSATPEPERVPERRQGFAAREAAMDEIRAREAQPGCPTGVTVIAGSMFFKDTDRVLKTMRRRGTAAAFGDGFARRYNPIHGADLAARCPCSRSFHSLQRDVDPRNS